MTILWHTEVRKLKDLKDFPNNPRKIGKEEFDNLVRSLKEDGYHQRLLINTDGMIIGGHQRKKALLKAGFTNDSELEVLVPDRLLEGKDFERINIRDNLPFGSFDFDILSSHFDTEQLVDWGMPADWLIGTEVEEIEATEADNEVPEVPEEAIAKLGDVWLLGEHRLMCGDSTNITDVEKLVDGNAIDMVYTDPPYGINIVKKDGKVGGDKSYRGSKCNVYAPIIGDESGQTAIDSYNLCASLNIPILIFWGGNHYSSGFPSSPCWIIWDKNNGDTDFADAELAWTNQKTAVRIFKHTWCGVIRQSENGQKRLHPTQKPIELALWCFKEYGKDAKNILDLFGGSGSTLIACEKSNCKCFMMELSPHYCDVIIARWEKHTNRKAELLPS